MNIPVLIKAPLSEKKSKLLRGKTLPYQYYIARDKHHYLYLSQSPSYARSEAWLARLKDISSDYDWGLIEHIEDQQYFIMFVSNNALLTTDEGNLDELLRDNAILLKRKGSQIFWCAPKQEKMIGEYVEPLSDNQLKPFALRRTLLKKKLLFVGLIPFVFIIWQGIQKTQTTESTATPPVDPYLDYRLAINGTSSAHSGLHQAANLATLSATIPQGWRIDSIFLNNGMTTLKVKRESGGERPDIRKWLSLHTDLKPFSQLTIDTLTINIPIKETLSSWQNRLMPSTLPLESMTDVLVALGWSFISPPMSNSRFTTTFTVQKQTDLTEILKLKNILKQLPISATANLTPIEQFWNIKITFTFYGAS